MRQALVKMHNLEAGVLIEIDNNASSSSYQFQYFETYRGTPISLTMPIGVKIHNFEHFPPFFDGVLPEGGQLEGLLRARKIDRYDYFSQLLAVGHDLVGAVTVFEK
jgi:serine/threonine-protein kinase HipA